jgi:lipoprotein-anchoring transpeptidase ErfK/SrfK
VPSTQARTTSTTAAPATTTTAPDLPAVEPFAPSGDDLSEPATVTSIASPVADTLSVRYSPGGPVWKTLPAVNEWGSKLALPVLDSQPGWLAVLLPFRPNGLRGWVAMSDVTTTANDWRIKVSIGQRRLVAEHGGVVVLDVPVVVGAKGYDTPQTLAAVRAIIPTGRPGGAYGPYALALGAYSNTLTEFAGGQGEVAIHGTNAPWRMGQAASHGCVRLRNADITTLVNAGLPVGTPVELVA